MRRGNHVRVVLAIASVVGLSACDLSVITIIGGNGTFGHTYGPGNLATTSEFGVTSGVGDPDGNYWISEHTTCRLRMVDRAGIAVPVAGASTCGYSGDGGPATNAAVNGPLGLWYADVAPQPYLLFSDQDNCIVRKIALAPVAALGAHPGATPGTITTVAGTAPIGGVPQCGFGGDDGPATSAQLNKPSQVTTDAAGNIFIADQDNCRIRKVTASTGVITTFAGDGECVFDGDGGSALTASLNHATGVAVDSTNNVFIAERNSHVIRKVTAATGTISTIAGTPGVSGLSGDGGDAVAAKLFGPVSLAMDAGNHLFVADMFNCRIRAIASGKINTQAGSTVAGNNCGSGADRTSPAGQLNWPASVFVTAGGDVVIGDSFNFKVKLLNEAATPKSGAVTQHSTLQNDWRAYGNSDTGVNNWTQADGTYSLKLPDGKIAWFFADSFVRQADGGGWIQPDHSVTDRENEDMLGNQFVLETVRVNQPPIMENQWSSPETHGQDYFAGTAPYHRFWPRDPFLINDTTIGILLHDIDIINGTRGVYLATIPLTGPTAYRPTTPVALPAAYPLNPADDPASPDYRPGAHCGYQPVTAVDPEPGADPENDLPRHVAYGEEVLVDAAAGYTYVFANESCPYKGAAPGSYLRLARVSGTDLTGTWSYWAGGTTWSTDPALSQRLLRTDGSQINDVGAELSVVKTSNGKYRMLSADLAGPVPTAADNTIGIATGDLVHGPYPTPTTLYTVPEFGQLTWNQPAPLPACVLFFYGAKEHPAFESGSKIVFSYNVHPVDADGNPSTNGCDPDGAPPWHDTIEDSVDNYRSRFMVRH